MALALGGDDLAARTLSNRRSFDASGRHSFTGVWQQELDVFSGNEREEDDEEELLGGLPLSGSPRTIGWAKAC
ncbi:UNVERIFIED_CONTAM: hypothetical protein Slati_2826600 [Sesamum latifolium]|uniref:Uncharacterized protein n=1 Tax=Sesamum latifolium TaxID=2727402 RepID=A0AAW2VBH4_9LAMI